MLLFDFSDKSLKIFKLSARFLGGEAISGLAKSELRPGLIENSEIRDGAALEKEIREILKKESWSDQEAAFVLHDERSFNLRLASPVTIDSKVSPDLLEKQLVSTLPVPISSVVYDAWGQQFAAVDRKIFSQYLDLFGKLELKPQLAVPESQAVWSFLLSQIGEGEMVLFLDIGAEATDAVLLDRVGVLQTFTEPIETTRLLPGVKEIISFSRDKFGKIPAKIFLGGGGALSLDTGKFTQDLGVSAVSIEEVLKTYPTSISANFGQTSKLGFVPLFGLALLAQQKKSPLNFVH